MTENLKNTAPVKLVVDDNSIGAPQTQWKLTLKTLIHNRSAMIGFVIILGLFLVAVFDDQIAPYDPIMSMLDVEGYEGTGRLKSKPPCITAFGCEDPQHFMGLDLNSRDMFSRIVHGTRISLRVGILAVTVAVSIGSLLGVSAGYIGGWVDDVIMRTMDVLLAFPSLLLAIMIVTIRGPGIQNALLAIGIVSIPVYARLTRASVLAVKEFEFVTAGRALGASPFRIVFLHILPNAITPIIVQATLGIGTAVIEAAGLSFLGLGAQPPNAEWGQMLKESFVYFRTAPHLVIFPGIAITITVLGFNLLGDGLRDVLDPRLRGTE